MSLHQLNPGFNDSLETYFPSRSFLSRAILLALDGGLRAGLGLRDHLLRGRLLPNERIVEYPQVFRWLRPTGRVLDVGCASSRLPLQLASLGYEVHGLDVRRYPLSHPNLTSHRADLFSWEPDCSFDVMLLISTIEHFGLGDYGDEVRPEADLEAVARIAAWLSEGGQMIVTVPFGRARTTPRHRIYDGDRLDRLFSGFRRIDETYFRRLEGSWSPCTAAELRDVDSPDLPVNGVALLNLEKTSRSGLDRSEIS